MKQNYINHFVLVLDASGSMTKVSRQLIKVADAQIAHLAARSKELDQETRVTVYVFNSTVECVIYDKDVLRLPSIAEFYRTGGMTALIKATLLSLDDLALTPQKYGDHAFLVYVLSDGEENQRGNPQELAKRIADLPENWTVAAFVPDAKAVFEAKKFGFPKDNIAIWDASTEAGVTEMGNILQSTTDSYMNMRASGGRGTRKLFTLDTSKLSKDTVNAKALTTLKKGTYEVLPVELDCTIRDFVEAAGHPFVIGNGYYQLSKNETIQAQKNIVVKRKSTGRFYAGAEARNLLGLPDYEVTVRPKDVVGFDIFVQSTSTNRRLKAGTNFLYILP